ncbi:MAG: hypothetical protein ACPHY8_01685 [Patescibacteria group bacterium]
MYEDILFVNKWNNLSGKNYSFPLKAQAKIRYRQADQDCEIYEVEG